MGTLASNLFIKDITKIDCAIFDPAIGILGQSWIMDVIINGELDNNGFVYDFSKLKNLVRQTTKQTIDHALLLPVSSRAVHYKEVGNEEFWQLHACSKLLERDFIWEYLCPKGATFPIHAVAIKPALVEQEFSKILKHRLPGEISSVQVFLREEVLAQTEASFRYTHGIRGHEGLCQRPFHGHRSRIEVYVNKDRRPDLEQYVVRELFDSNIHIASSSQILSGPAEVGRRLETSDPVKLSYVGSLGRYEAIVPSNRLFVVDGDTSIECITLQISKDLETKLPPRSHLKVLVNEGIDKGSFFEGDLS